MIRISSFVTAMVAVIVLVVAVPIGAARAQTAEETASYVVLASTAPGFAVGALVDDRDPLEVPSGASLTLIDAAGAIKVIEGPFFGRLRSDSEDDDGPDFLSDLANIIAATDTDEVALGLGRSVLVPEVSPWLVAFDDAMPENLCVSPDGQLVFLRAVADNPLRLRFATADGSAEVTVEWPTEDPLLRWPEALPPTDGGAYVIDPGTALVPPQVLMHLTPADLDSDAHAAVWLARSGCAAQAQAMVRRLAFGG